MYLVGHGVRSDFSELEEVSPQHVTIFFEVHAQLKYALMTITLGACLGGRMLLDVGAHAQFVADGIGGTRGAVDRTLAACHMFVSLWPNTVPHIAC